MKLSIIIVSYNTCDILRNCLLSVFKSLGKSELNKDGQSEVIVIDNASSDSSIEMIEKEFPNVNLVRNKENLGFAAANNIGLKKAHSDFILLLNSDTSISENTLGMLFSVARDESEAGVIGTKLVFPNGKLQQSLGFFPTLIKIFAWMTFIDDVPFSSTFIRPYHVTDKSFYRRKRSVDWVSGACLLVKKKVIEKAGYLDDKIFMYAEEVEWCFRIKKEGFDILYIPSIKVVHHKGASGMGDEAGIIEEFNSLIYIYKKHFPNWQQIPLKLLLKFGSLLRILVFGIIGGNSRRFSLYVKAFKLVG